MFETLTQHPGVTKVLTVLPEDAPTYIVGGAVRDMLLGRPALDVDLVVCQLPLDDLRTALRNLGPVNTNGQAWGVLTVMVEGDDIDVALPREEETVKQNGGYFDTHATPNPALPIEADLKRRDFTVNAMAVDARTGELVDPFHGQTDVQHRLLRTAGNPVTRFTEDHSRILRCLRLATQLGFQVEDLTWNGLKQVVKTAGQLQIPKRIWEQEFAKAQADLPAFHEWLQKAGIEPTHV